VFVHRNESDALVNGDGHQGKYASSTDPEYEIQKMLAVNDLISGTYKTVVALSLPMEGMVAKLVKAQFNARGGRNCKKGTGVNFFLIALRAWTT